MINSLMTTPESFVSLDKYLHDPDSHLNWNLVFTLPSWMKVWWQNFGSGAELYLRSVLCNDKVIGIAPLQIRHRMASIIGSVDVCDYQDFILVPGNEKEFFNTILDDLLHKGIQEIHLETIRSDSTIATHLIPLAHERQYKIDYRQSDVTATMALPRTWEEYLRNLDNKQRHEIKRKMRNLEKAGKIDYHTISDSGVMVETMSKFLKLFPESRSDKAHFMTSEMQNFFLSLADSFKESGLMKFGVLEISGQKTAMVLFFDYNESRYLYNSAYDPKYRGLSAGIISKARCIQDSIENGKENFDFLKGAEKYKVHLGGQVVPLYSCHITME